MNYSQVLKEIYRYFPSLLKNSAVFNQLWQKIIPLIKEGKQALNFQLSSSFFLEYLKQGNIEDKYITDSENTLLRFLILTKLGCISFYMKTMNNGYYFKLGTVNSLDHINEDTEFFINLENVVRLDNTVKKEEGYKITDYDYRIWFFKDDEYLIIDTTEMENKEFADVFHIPIEEVPFYRANFKKNQDYLASQRMLDVYEMVEETFPQFKTTFCSPFLLSNFSDFVIEEFFKEINIKQTDTGMDEERLEIIRTKLFELLGKDSEVVFSQSFFDNITTYLFDLDMEILNARGFVLKKEADGYILYRIQMDKEEMVSFQWLLTKEQAQEIYEKSESNKEVEGLKEFFGIERSR